MGERGRERGEREGGRARFGMVSSHIFVGVMIFS